MSKSKRVNICRRSSRSIPREHVSRTTGPTLFVFCKGTILTADIFTRSIGLKDTSHFKWHNRKRQVIVSSCVPFICKEINGRFQGYLKKSHIISTSNQLPQMSYHGRIFTCFHLHIHLKFTYCCFREMLTFGLLQITLDYILLECFITE